MCYEYLFHQCCLRKQEAGEGEKPTATARRKLEVKREVQILAVCIVKVSSHRISRITFHDVPSTLSFSSPGFLPGDRACAAPCVFAMSTRSCSRAGSSRYEDTVVSSEN